MKTTRFVSVYDEQDHIEFQIVGPFELPDTYCIEKGMIRMPAPLDPPESTLPGQHGRIHDK